MERPDNLRRGGESDATRGVGGILNNRTLWNLPEARGAEADDTALTATAFAVPGAFVHRNESTALLLRAAAHCRSPGNEREETRGREEDGPSSRGMIRSVGGARGEG